MKKFIFSVLLLMIINSVITTAYATTGNSNMDISSQILGIDTAGINPAEPAARRTLALISAKFYGVDEYNTNREAYEDVNDDDYAVYYATDYGMMTDVGDNKFDPNGAVTKDDLILTAVKCLNNSDFTLSSTSDYAAFLSSHGVSVNVKNKDKVSNKELFNVVMDILETDAIDIYKNNRGISIINKGISVMEERFKIRGYKGLVESVSFDNSLITVSNVTDLQNGNITGTSTFDVKKGLDAREYTGVPADVYIADGDELVAIVPQKGISWKYTYITSVNGDENPDSAYVPSYIQKIMLVNDKKKYYVQGDTLNFYFNNIRSDKPEKIIGRFAKIVTDDNKIISIYAVEMDDSGYITELSRKEISYSNDNAGNKKIKDLDKYINQILIYNGQIANISDLKETHVFEYRVFDDETIFIVSTDETIIGTFKGWDSEYFNIDGETILYDKVYFSKDGGKTFFANKENEFIGTEVKAALNPYGKCAYVFQISGEGLDPFLAAVTKVIKNEDDEIITIDLLPLEGDTFEKRRYIVSRKVRYEDGLSYDDLKHYQNDAQGRSIYEFRLNGKGEIKQINMPAPLYGQTAYSAPQDELYNSSYFYSTLPDGIGHLCFDYKQEFVLLKKGDGGYMTAEKKTWGELQNRKSSGCYINYYGYEDSISPRLIVICGNTTNIVSLQEKMGVVTSKRIFCNDDNEIQAEITIGGWGKYRVSENSIEGLKPMALVLFNDEMNKFNIDGFDANIITYYNLPDEMRDWNVRLGNKSYVIKKVYMIDDYRILFTDGTIGVISKDIYQLKILEYDASADKNDRFTIGDFSKISTGKYVLIENSETKNWNKDLIDTIIYEK